MNYGDYVRERIAHTENLRVLEGNTLCLTKCKEKPLKAFTLYGNSEGVENPEIIVCGKNLLDIDAGLNDNFVKNDDGTYTLTKLSNVKRLSNKIPFNFPDANFSFYVEIIDTNVEKLSAIQALIVGADGIKTYPTLSNIGRVYNAFAGVTGTLQIYLNITDADGSYVKFKNPQIAIYNTPVTEYEPYKTPKKVSIPYTFAENDYLMLSNKKVKTFINGVQTDITDSEIGQAILNLKCFEPSTTILCNSEIQPNNMYIKYISK